MVVAITTSNGGPFYVDAELVDTPLTYTWMDGTTAVFTLSSLSFYWNIRDSSVHPRATVMVNGECRSVYPHRLVIEAPATHYVDHVDHDTRNNTKANLRIATASQNAANRKLVSRLRLKFKGTEERRGGRFRGVVRKDYVRHRSPTFLTEEEAARWYDSKARELHGPFAFVNFPEEAAANG